MKLNELEIKERMEKENRIQCEPLNKNKVPKNCQEFLEISMQ